MDIEVKDEQLAAHLRELGYEPTAWLKKGGKTVTFFTNSQRLRGDIRRYRRIKRRGIRAVTSLVL